MLSGCGPGPGSSIHEPGRHSRHWTSWNRDQAPGSARCGSVSAVDQERYPARASFLVPAIAYYEVCRELERLNNATGIARLDAFCSTVPGRYLILTDEALRLGCKLWAQARRLGMPTADPRELDGDVLLAAQALTLGVATSDLIVATTNVGHLSQFVTADLWTNITL
jgi:hypothetical protein